MTFRFRVFNKFKSDVPVFSSPWYWIASMYTTSVSGDWEYCRIDDSKLNKTLYEWARAGSPIYENKHYRVILKDGTVLDIEAVNEQQARNIVIYGHRVSFDEPAVKLNYRIHPENIAGIEVRGDEHI